MKIFYLGLGISVILTATARAQYSEQKEAMYMGLTEICIK